MANSPQARKRARQAEKSRSHNTSMRSMMRTYVKKVLKAITEGNKKVALEAYKSAVSVIDRVAGKGIIHKNKAARHKSRLNKKIKELSDSAA